MHGNINRDRNSRKCHKKAVQYEKMHNCVKFSVLPKTPLTVIFNLAQVVIIVAPQEV